MLNVYHFYTRIIIHSYQDFTYSLLEKGIQLDISVVSRSFHKNALLMIKLKVALTPTNGLGC